MLPSLRRGSVVASLVVVLLALGTGRALAKPDPTQAKINIVIEMLNAWSGYVYDNQAGYTAWADPATGPTCKETKLRGPSSMGDSTPATFAGYQKAFAKKPKLAVDVAAQQMVSALIAMRAPTNEASEYYFKRKFKDDDCKRGKELHGELLAQWQAFITAEREVRTFIVTYNDSLQVAQLAKTKKKYGEKLRYHFEKSLGDAKVLIREVDTQLAAPTADYAAISARLADFDATITATAALVEKERNNSKVYDVLYQGGYTQFVRFAGNFRDDVKRLVDEQAKPSKNAKQQASQLERDHKQIITDYNVMIDGANRVQLSAKIK